MADEKPLDEIIGEGADRGPAAQSERAPEPTPEPRQDTRPEASADDKSWTYHALRDERSKRQALADRVAELEAERQHYAQQQQQPDGDDIWTDPDKYIARRIHEATMPTRLAASEANARLKYGDEFGAMETALQTAMAANHPDLPLLREACLQSGDPSEVAMQWFRSTQAERPQQRRGPVYPSNLSSARNVGSRSGPAWSGPTPLDDIFDRGRR